jgi:hypothetical protein
MSKLTCFSVLVFGGVLAVTPALQARTCSGNADLIGGYGWIGGRSAAFVVPVAAPATTTTTAAATTPAAPVGGSKTQIGALTAGAANSAAFASVGRLYLDGAGFMFSSSSPATPVLQVGTYTVNADCTISATFTDTFATPGAAGLTPVQASVTFEGAVVQNGNEVDLAQTGTATGTVITLKKTKQFNGCTTDSLTGTFGLAASGVTTAAPTPGATAVSTPFNLFGRISADGTGLLVQDSVGIASPLTQRQFTGTYAINLDCTGSATLVGSDTKSRKIDFVIVTPNGPNSTNGAQTLAFIFTDSGVVGSGLAQQQ